MVMNDMPIRYKGSLTLTSSLAVHRLSIDATVFLKKIPKSYTLRISLISQTWSTLILNISLFFPLKIISLSTKKHLQISSYMWGCEPLHHLQPVHHTPHVVSQPPQGQDDLLLQLGVMQPLCPALWTIPSTSPSPAAPARGPPPRTALRNTTCTTTQDVRILIYHTNRHSRSSVKRGWTSGILRGNISLRSLQLWLEPSRPVSRLLLLGPWPFPSSAPSPPWPAPTCLTSSRPSSCWLCVGEDSRDTWPFWKPLDFISGIC